MHHVCEVQPFAGGLQGPRPVPATISVQVGRERKGIEKLFPKKRFPSSRPIRFVNAFHAMANMDGFRVYNILIHAGKSTLQKFRISKYFRIIMILFFAIFFVCNLHQDDDNVTIYLREGDGHVSLVHLEPNYFSAFCSRDEDAEDSFNSRIITTKIRIKFHRYRSSLSLSRCCPGGETRCSRWPTSRKTWMQESGYNVFAYCLKIQVTK